jgi:putative heme-binding domain-containing protein
VDYYRQIIEHPEWMGEEVIKSGALYNGHDRGRIYRITTTNAKGAEWTRGLELGDQSSEQLVQHLSNPNGWWRLNAQRLLIDRKEKSLVPAIMKMAQNSNSALGRLHALWTLEGMGELRLDLIKQVLKDPVAGVRENAIQLTGLNLDSPDLRIALMGLQDDVDAKVRFQLLCILGSKEFASDAEALAVRNKLLFRDINDKWVQVAALSGSSLQTASLLNVVLDSFRHDLPAYSSLIQRLSSMIAGSRNRASINQLIQKSTSGAREWQAPLLEGLAQGFKNQKAYTASKEEQDILTKTFFEHPSTRLRDASLALLKVMSLPDKISKKQSIQKAVSIAVDVSQPEEKRVQAIQFIALDNPDPHMERLKKLIVPSEPSSIQVAAVRTLSSIKDTNLTQYLLLQWSQLTPRVQDEAMNTFLTDTIRQEMLLDAIEKGTVQPGAVGWPRTVRLMAQSNIRLRTKARSLLSQTDEQRVALNKEYQTALTLEGNADKGKIVYQKSCSPCHQVRGQLGRNFGPDLGSIHNWSRDAIMLNILSPNLSISSGYAFWDVELKNGETFQGIISSETATALTLKNAAMETRTINRADIKSLKAINISAMPTGLEKQINQQQMADLLAYLKQVK